MKHSFVLLFVLCFAGESIGQTHSARLAGMGNLSIAIPDVQAEVFVNPARATRFRGIFVRGNPFLSTYGTKLKSSLSRTTRNESFTSDYEDNLRSLSVPLDFLISLGTLALGALLESRLIHGTPHQT